MELILTLLPILFLAILGAAVGSFLNVVIYRSWDPQPRKKKESWVTGRSRCDSCHTLISWYDNIPLLSFFVLGGRCRNCHKPISRNHLALEILMAALFVWWYIWGSLLFFKLGEMPFAWIQPLYWLIIGILLLFIVMADLIYFIIPDSAVTLLTVITLGYRLALVAAGIMRSSDLLWSVVAAVIAVLSFGGLWLLTKGKGLGFGDVKLILPLSLLVGWPGMLVMILGAFISGSVVGVGLIVTRKHKWRQPIPFGPFLIASTCASLIWGEALVAWYLGYLQ